VATAATFAAAWMAGMSMMFQSLEQPDGSLRSPLQADWGTLLPFLLACVPAVAAAGAAALGALAAVRSRPAALGLAAGVQVSLGLVALLQQLARGQGSLVSGQGPALYCARAAAPWFTCPAQAAPDQAALADRAPRHRRSARWRARSRAARARWRPGASSSAPPAPPARPRCSARRRRIRS
jgi:hypothetical protein